MSKWEGIATKKIALWIALVFLIPSAAFADEIEIEGFTHDSVVFTFSNARFVTYEGIDSLSVDVEAEVQANTTVEEEVQGESPTSFQHPVG